MTVKNSDVLTAARRLISDPKNWTTGTTARDRNGNKVQADDPFACSWCAFGAVFRAWKTFGESVEIEELFIPLNHAAYQVIPEFTWQDRKAYGERTIVILNDKAKDHAAVIRAYDLAIETEKAREETEALKQTGKADA